MIALISHFKVKISVQLAKKCIFYKCTRCLIVYIKPEVFIYHCKVKPKACGIISLSYVYLFQFKHETIN